MTAKTGGKKVYKKKTSKKSRATTASTIAKVIRSSQETKHFTYQPWFNEAIADTGADITGPLNAPVVGSAYYQRIGSRIQEVSLRINGVIGVPAAQTAFADCVRIVVVRDSAGFGTTPTEAEIFETAQPAAGSTAFDTAIAPQKWETRKRFTVLKDFCIPVMQAIATQAVRIPFMAEFKLNKKLDFFASSAAASAGDLRIGGIYLLAMCDSTVNVLTITMASSFNYKDA